MKKATSNVTFGEVKARRMQVIAPPFVFGPSVPVIALFGVTGPNAESNVARIQLNFETRTHAAATFDVEITGGDELVRAIGPGSATVTVSGNVATEIQVRCRSHSPITQHVIVTAF